ncbi:MAG: BamA/TamA family outer membrane protein [Candidatus Eiseniibacteriota bacterium]|jgi:outer membrane protein insertion porin family
MVALGIALVVAVAAGADDEDPSRLEGRPVLELRFTGNETLQRSLLEAAVYTRSGGGFLFWKRVEPFVAGEFERDALRLRVLYRRYGFFEATVRGRVEPLDHGVRVTFVIDEGPATVIGSLAIEGWPEQVTDPEHWPEPLALPAGSRWRQADVERAGRRLADSLLAHGYWRVEVLQETRREDHTATVTLRVTPGPVYWLARVEVIGRGRVPRWIVDESLGLEPGTPFRAAGVAAARRRLSRLQLFRRVETGTTTIGADSVAVTIEVEPGGHLSRGFGIGYGTEDKVRLRAFWSDRNFLGGARQMHVDGRWSGLGAEAGLKFVQPRFPVHPFRTELGARFERLTEENYTLRRPSIEAWLRRPLPARFELGVGIDIARNSLDAEDPDIAAEVLAEDPRRSAELRLELRRTTADDLLSPGRGSRLLLNAAWSDTDLIAEASYGVLELDLRRYHPLGDAHLVALRQTFGLSLPRGTTRVMPVWRRQYAGGASDMRSYARRTLGPLDDDGDGLGGELATVSVVELRLLREHWLGVALFGEMGGVWGKLAEVRPATLRFGAGFGLRLRTPVGPVRADFGHKVGGYDRRLDAWIYHLSIGEAF